MWWPGAVGLSQEPPVPQQKAEVKEGYFLASKLPAASSPNFSWFALCFRGLPCLPSVSKGTRSLFCLLICPHSRCEWGGSVELIRRLYDLENDLCTMCLLFNPVQVTSPRPWNERQKHCLSFEASLPYWCRHVASCLPDFSPTCAGPTSGAQGRWSLWLGAVLPTAGVRSLRACSQLRREILESGYPCRKAKLMERSAQMGKMLWLQREEIFERVSLCTMKFTVTLLSLKEIPVKLDHWA